MLSIPSPNSLDATRLVVERTSSPKPVPDSSTLVFGQTFTDHMLTVRWNISTGWDAPVIKPYAPLQLDPASTVLHYAPTLFEGMKVRVLGAHCSLVGQGADRDGRARQAYKDKQGRTRLFRPDLNMARCALLLQRRYSHAVSLNIR